MIFILGSICCSFRTFVWRDHFTVLFPEYGHSEKQIKIHIKYCTKIFMHVIATIFHLSVTDLSKTNHVQCVCSHTAHSTQRSLSEFDLRMLLLNINLKLHCHMLYMFDYVLMY